MLTRRPRPLPLTGATRTLADLTMSAGALAAFLRSQGLRGLDPAGALRFARSQLALAEGLRQNKYVLFDGKIFVDVFAPHWPSRGFDQMMATYATNALSPEADRREFIAYMTVAITQRCVFRCKHCYAVHTLSARDVVPLGKLLEVIEQLLTLGVGVLSLEGGEPLLRFDDLLAILRAIGGRATCYLATTGYGLTAEKARALRRAGLDAAQVSLDHFEPEKHNELRGSRKAFDAACAALRLFAEAGVLPVVAVCATPQIVDGDGLFRHLELARQLGAGIVQVLDPMPAGNYLDGQPGTELLTPAQLEQVMRFHVEANTARRFRHHPAVCARAHVEAGCRYGCGLGGNQHLYVDAAGNVTPCVYLNASAGNILDEDFRVIFRRLRRLFPQPVDGFCPVHELAPHVAARARSGEALPLHPRHLPDLAALLAGRGLPGLFRRMQSAV